MYRAFIAAIVLSGLVVAGACGSKTESMALGAEARNAQTAEMSARAQNPATPASASPAASAEPATSAKAGMPSRLPVVAPT